MSLKKMVSRLRAAHALSFAMASFQKPSQSDKEEAGLGCIDWNLVGARHGDRELPWLQEPKAAPTDATPDLRRGAGDQAAEAA